MILLKIWLIVSVLDLAAFIYIIFDGAQRFKKENPNTKLKKPSISKLVFALIRIIVVSVLPGIHISLLTLFICSYEKLLEKVMENLEGQEI